MRATVLGQQGENKWWRPLTSCSNSHMAIGPHTCAITYMYTAHTYIHASDPKRPSTLAEAPTFCWLCSSDNNHVTPFLTHGQAGLKKRPFLHVCCLLPLALRGFSLVVWSTPIFSHVAAYRPPSPFCFLRPYCTGFPALSNSLSGFASQRLNSFIQGISKRHMDSVFLL